MALLILHNINEQRLLSQSRTKIGRSYYLNFRPLHNGGFSASCDVVYSVKIWGQICPIQKRRAGGLLLLQFSGFALMRYHSIGFLNIINDIFNAFNMVNPVERAVVYILDIKL